MKDAIKSFPRSAFHRADRSNEAPATRRDREHESEKKMKTYQIIARGDFISWHKSLSRATEKAENLDNYDQGEVRIFEVPNGGEMPIDTYPMVWSND